MEKVAGGGGEGIKNWGFQLWSQSSFSPPRLQRLGGDSDAIQPRIGKSSRCTAVMAKALTVHRPAAPAASTCPAPLHLVSLRPGAALQQHEADKHTNKVSLRKQPAFQSADLQLVLNPHGT